MIQQTGTVGILYQMPRGSSFVHHSSLLTDSTAFSSPEMHVDYNSSMDTLRCEAPRWFPQPVVVWTSHNNTRDNLAEVSNTSFKLNSENVTMNVVSVLHNITANTTYTCVIKNDIAKATGDIKVTGTFQHHLKALDMG